MRWSERPPVACPQITWLNHSRFGPHSLSVAVAHLVLVRLLRPVRFFLLLVLLVPALVFGAPPDFSADSVEVFRVAPRWEKQKATGKMFHQYKVLAGPRRISKPAARSVTRELERVYPVDWPPKYCAFVPRYGIRLNCPSGRVDVLICPHCAEVHFIMGNRLRVASVSGEILRQLSLLFPDHPLRDDEA